MRMNHHYQLPPEWAPQSGVMLTWPRTDGDWNPDYASVERCHTQLAAEISKREQLIITCMDGVHADKIRGMVKSCRRPTGAPAPVCAALKRRLDARPRPSHRYKRWPVDTAELCV